MSFDLGVWYVDAPMSVEHSTLRTTHSWSAGKPADCANTIYGNSPGTMTRTILRALDDNDSLFWRVIPFSQVVSLSWTACQQRPTHARRLNPSERCGVPSFGPVPDLAIRNGPKVPASVATTGAMLVAQVGRCAMTTVKALLTQSAEHSGGGV